MKPLAKPLQRATRRGQGREARDTFCARCSERLPLAKFGENRRCRKEVMLPGTAPKRRQGWRTRWNASLQGNVAEGRVESRSMYIFYGRNCL